MNPKPAKVIRAAEIQRERLPYTQRLNPRSRFEGTELAHPGGLQRVGVSIAWLRPGSETFAFHQPHLYLLKRDPGQRTSFHLIGNADYPFGSADDENR